MSTVDVSLWPWHLAGGGDFADAAWWAAEVLGNAPGVESLGVRRDTWNGLPRVSVRMTSNDALRALVHGRSIGAESLLEHTDGSVSWCQVIDGVELFVYTDATWPEDGA